MDTNGIIPTKLYVNKVIEKRFPKKKGIRKSKFFDNSEQAWFLVVETDRKNLYQIYVLKETEKQIRMYNFFNSSVAQFVMDEEFTLQSTREKVKDLKQRCKTGWRECQVEIFTKERLNPSEATTT